MTKGIAFPLFLNTFRFPRNKTCLRFFCSHHNFISDVAKPKSIAAQHFRRLMSANGSVKETLTRGELWKTRRTGDSVNDLDVIKKRTI
jgi:hypothetical protein